jgi:hypothetical protein
MIGLAALALQSVPVARMHAAGVVCFRHHDILGGVCAMAPSVQRLPQLLVSAMEICMLKMRMILLQAFIDIDLCPD